MYIIKNKFIYKVAKNETPMTVLAIDGNDLFVISKSNSKDLYYVYKINKNKSLDKLFRSDNPIELENKCGYTKMCEEIINGQ